MHLTRHLFAELAWRLALLALAGSAVALAAWGAHRLGPAFDEPSDITAGYVFWRAGEGLEDPGRPFLGLMLESVGLWVTWGESIDDWPGLPERDLDRLTAHVLSGEIPVMRMLWWARVPGLIATLLTALLIFRGAMALWHSHTAGLLATAAFCLLPSTLAHAARADGAALAGLWVTGGALAGWRWLRREGSGWSAVGYGVAALLTDFTTWVLLPFVGMLVAARAAGVPPAAPRSKGIGTHQGGETSLPSPAAHPSAPLAAALVRGAWMPAGRLLLGALLVWLLVVELTGNWALWWDLWRAWEHHWTAWRGGALPLHFHGGFFMERPSLYQPALLLLKTPLWLPALWLLAMAAVRADRSRDTLQRWALVYLQAVVVWHVAVGFWLFPPRGYAVWVPIAPLACIIVGGAALWPSLASSPQVRLGRAALLGAVIAVGTWKAIATAPHWHAQWNAVAWITGGGRDWFASPENDAGPAMPMVRDHLLGAGLGDEILFVAHHGRWPPRALGLRALHLPGHGLILEPEYRFATRRPPPGLYIIAASLLAGQDLAYADNYRWFRERPAEVWIGDTVGLWRVREETGPEPPGGVNEGQTRVDAGDSGSLQ